MEQAMESLRCPPSDALVENLSGGARVGGRGGVCVCRRREIVKQLSVSCRAVPLAKRCWQT